MSFGLGFFIVFLPIGDRRRLAWPSLILATIGSMFALWWGVVFWLHPTNIGVALFNGPPLLGSELSTLRWEFAVNQLGALFLLLVGGGALVVSLYSFAYLGLVPLSSGKPEKDAHGIAAAYNLFVGAMLLAIAANNIFPLLICLEVMSLAFGYLVLYRHNKGRDMEGEQWRPTDRRARKLAIQAYLISSHISLVLFAAGLLIRATQAGDFSFDVFRLSRTTADPLTFWLVFVGLAIRAGVAPFHIWVPLAHPSSPTNTHALSLGVAIKIPIYLMIRLFFGLMGPIPGWWGPVLLLFAALTAVVGIFYAQTSRDLKTALSYSSVENVGIILVGVGLALTLASTDFNAIPGMVGLAGLALVAALFQAVNHSFFKGLLYLATGAIERLAGAVEYRKLGGLMKRFPWTASAFLAGAVSIAGFPPFNGFISEWLILQGLFAALSAFAASRLIFPACAIVVAIALLALTFGLTAFAFVKIAGIAVLGAPRRERELDSDQREMPWFVRLLFMGLAGMCLLIGILPWPILALLAQVTQSIGLPALALSERGGTILVNSHAGVGVGAYTSALGTGWIGLLAAVCVALVVIIALQHRSKRNAHVRMALPIWSSGIDYDGAHMQATGAYFGYQVDVPLRRRVGAPIGNAADGGRRSGSAQTTELPPAHTAEIIPEGVQISDQYQVMEYFQKIYNGGLVALQRFAARITLLLQNGRERVYVAYTTLTLAGLLVAWLIWGGR